MNTIEFIIRPHCELCGYDHPTTLLSKSFLDPSVWGFIEHYYAGRVDKQVLGNTIYKIACCPLCGFIWQVNILNNFGMAALYDNWISAEDSLHKKQSSGEEEGYLRQVELIHSFMPHKPADNIHVLDFGMGWGYWCMAARKVGYQVTGMEIAKTRLEFVRNQGIQAISNFEELGSQKFDFINAEQVFEHIPNPLATLNILIEHLTPGGIIRIAVPDGKNIAREVTKPDWKAFKNAIHPLEHINCFRHSTLAYMGKVAGVSVIPQPIRWSLSKGGKPLFRSLAASVYRRFWGTVLFFQNK